MLGERLHANRTRAGSAREHPRAGFTQLLQPLELADSKRRQVNGVVAAVLGVRQVPQAGLQIDEPQLDLFDFGDGLQHGAVSASIRPSGAHQFTDPAAGRQDHPHGADTAGVHAGMGQGVGQLAHLVRRQDAVPLGAGADDARLLQGRHRIDRDQFPVQAEGEHLPQVGEEHLCRALLALGQLRVDHAQDVGAGHVLGGQVADVVEDVAHELRFGQGARVLAAGALAAWQGAALQLHVSPPVEQVVDSDAALQLQLGSLSGFFQPA